MIHVLLPKELDISNIKYSDAKSNIMGGQSVFITNNDSKIYIQTPKCKCISGVSHYTTSNGDTIQSLNLTLSSSTESNIMIKTFLEVLDESNIIYAEKSSLKWFKKLLSRDIIMSMYNMQVQNDKFKVKLPMKNSDFEGLVFDKNNKEIELESIKPGCTVQCIIECSGIYFMPSKFGISWKALQIKLLESPTETGYSFIDEEIIDKFEDVEPMT